MNLVRRSRSLFNASLILLIAGGLPVALAQEEAAEAEQVHALFYQGEAWAAQPVGLGYVPTTVNDPLNPFATRVVTFENQAQTKGRHTVGWNLPNQIGQVSFTYFNHEDEGAVAERSPGDFRYTESTVNRLHAGYDYRGLADGFSSSSATRLRDYHIDFRRLAFRTNRVSADWSVGWRRVNHDRRMATTYFALVPDQPPTNLPPVCTSLPNCADMTPLADRSVIGSNYSGRGLNAGFDVRFHLWKSKFVLEAGIAIGILRGKMDTEYGSVAYRYWDSAHDVLVGPPFEEFNQCENDPYPANGCSSGNPELVDSIDQQSIAAGLNSSNVSTSGSVLDTYVGLRWSANHFVDLIVGIRQTDYRDVGMDLRGSGDQLIDISSGSIGTELIDFAVPITSSQAEPRSAVYEGFYLGAKFSFF